MKKSILNLGTPISKKHLQKINGGIGICSTIPSCPKINDKYCIVVGIGICYVAG